MTSDFGDLEATRRLHDDFLALKQNNQNAIDTYQKKKVACEKLKSVLEKLQTENGSPDKITAAEANLTSALYEETKAKEYLDNILPEFTTTAANYQRELIEALCTPLSKVAMKAGETAMKIADLAYSIESSANSIICEEDPTTERLSQILATIDAQLSYLHQGPADPQVPTTDVLIAGNDEDRLEA